MRLSVRLKMSTLGIVLLLCMAVGWVGLTSMGRIYSNLDDTYRNRLVPIQYSSSLRGGMENSRLINTCKVCHPDNRSRMGDAQGIDDQIANNLRLLSASSLSTEGKMQLAAVQTTWTDYKRNRDIINTSVSGDTAKAKLQLMTTEEDRFKPVASALAQFDAVNQSMAETAYRASQAIYNDARWITLALVIVAVLFGGGVGYVLSNNISSAASAHGGGRGGHAKGSRQPRRRNLLCGKRGLDRECPSP